MTYTEYKDERSKSFDKLPVFFAFSNQQFEEKMNERGLTINDTDKIYKLGDTGGFYLKKDSEKVRAYFSGDNLRELMNDKEFAISAFEYEMQNHEYAINYYQGDWDVCSCFCKCEWADDKTFEDYLIEGGYSDEHVKWFAEALRLYRKKSEDLY